MKSRRRGLQQAGAGVFLLLLMLLLPWGSAPAQEGIRILDETLQMGLGDYFFREGDFYRAITEYQRFLYFFPRSPRAEEALWKIAQAYFNGRKWDEAIDAAHQLTRRFPDSAYAAEASLLEGRSFAEKKEFERARLFFQNVAQRAPGTALADEARRQIALTYIKEERWREAAQELRKIDKSSKLFPPAEAMARGLERISEVPRKSPVAAGVLAAVLPGAGHFYTERYRDGAIALGLNGAFIWGLVEAFEHKNYVLGGILAFFELGWYTGNIYSAVNGAHKYNRNQKDQYLERLEKESHFSAGISLLGPTPVLCLNYAF